ncbi:beta-N-acetylhexosaminidase, partial [Flavihumibacter sediminis]|nr:beta-N-acetylhexosaminidase [Flavihumibacter sediminis]
MDPHEAVVTLFHRQIGDRTKADASMLGGIICVWNDRRLINENYHLLINGVYPSMLAFAERSWRGGGILKWTAVIGEKNTNEANQFIEFEGRLMKHKKAYFRNEP